MTDTLERRARSRRRARIRAVVSITLLVLWAAVAVTGFIMFSAPTGRGAGKLTYVLFKKETWGDIHFAIAIAAVLVTILHVVIDWKALRSCVRFLTSSERVREPAVG